MSSLFGTLAVSERALLAQQGALATTSDNIANINTPGYCRKRAVLAEDVVFVQGGAATGNGVHLQSVQGVRDRVLDLRICHETQEQGALSAFVSAMSQVDTQFSDVDNGIGAKIDAFFDALGSLSTDPANLAQRQSVLVAAGDLAHSLNSTAQQLKSLQLTIDSGLEQSIEKVNEVSGQIAKLNDELAKGHVVEGDGSLEDQRTELIRTLSEQIDVSVIQSDESISITTKAGAPLVVGGKAFSLKTAGDGNGFKHIYSDGTDITASLTGGAIGGQLRARDTEISGILANLNALAAGLATSVNQANRSGTDLSGNPGADIFAIPTQDAAANCTLVISDPKLLALSADGAAGDNGNLAAFQAARDGGMGDGAGLLDYYAGLVSRVGNTVSGATAELDAGEVLLGKLTDQRGAVSGVSLDEEAADIVRFQRAFQASARVVSVIDEMLKTLLTMGQQ